MSSAPGMCQTYPAYTSGAPEDVSTALHGSGEGSLCTKVHAAPASPLYGPAPAVAEDNATSRNGPAPAVAGHATAKV